MIKKWFDWTERDIAAWEKLRAGGPWRFILGYGIGLTGGGLFLLLQIAFLAGLSLLGGLVNGLVTWLMEETIYRRVYWQKRPKPQ